MQNFPGVVEDLLEGGGALQAPDAATLERLLRELLTQPERRATMGARGRAAVAARRGAVDRTARMILDAVTR